MKWPWVGRLAFDAVIDERDRLRKANDELTEHFTRMDRVEHHLAEAPRPERKEIERMPAMINHYIEGFASKNLQKEMRREAKARYRHGQSWEAIWSDIKKEDPGAVVEP